MLTLGIFCTIVAISMLVFGGHIYIKGSEQINVNKGYWGGVLVAMGTVLIIFGPATMVTKTKPTAMDVYRNKTELQYTVKGSTITDSVVVFRTDSK